MLTELLKEKKRGNRVEHWVKEKGKKQGTYTFDNNDLRFQISPAWTQQLQLYQTVPSWQGYTGTAQQLGQAAMLMGQAAYTGGV